MKIPYLTYVVALVALALGCGQTGQADPESDQLNQLTDERTACIKAGTYTPLDDDAAKALVQSAVANPDFVKIGTAIDAEGCHEINTADLQAVTMTCQAGGTSVSENHVIIDTACGRTDIETPLSFSRLAFVENVHPHFGQGSAAFATVGTIDGEQDKVQTLVVDEDGSVVSVDPTTGMPEAQGEAAAASSACVAAGGVGLVGGAVLGEKVSSTILRRKSYTRPKNLKNAVVDLRSNLNLGTAYKGLGAGAYQDMLTRYDQKELLKSNQFAVWWKPFEDDYQKLVRARDAVPVYEAIAIQEFFRTLWDLGAQAIHGPAPVGLTAEQTLSHYAERAERAGRIAMVFDQINKRTSVNPKNLFQRLGPQLRDALAADAQFNGTDFTKLIRDVMTAIHPGKPELADEMVSAFTKLKDHGLFRTLSNTASGKTAREYLSDTVVSTYTNTILGKELFMKSDIASRAASQLEENTGTTRTAVHFFPAAASWAEAAVTRILPKTARPGYVRRTTQFFPRWRGRIWRTGKAALGTAVVVLVAAGVAGLANGACDALTGGGVQLPDFPNTNSGGDDVAPAQDNGGGGL